MIWLLLPGIRDCDRVMMVLIKSLRAFSIDLDDASSRKIIKGNCKGNCVKTLIFDLNFNLPNE